MIRLVVPEASPSLNTYTYSHWRVQHTDKRRWALMLLAEMRHANAPSAIGKRRLTIERHGRRRLDPDNIIGGAKSCIIDNLRNLGLLLDDHDDVLELVAKNVAIQRGEQPHTVLVLEDVD